MTTGAGGLTAKQLLVYRAIRKEYRATGIPPTLQYISSHFGWSSKNAAAVHIRPLVKKGALRAVQRGTRNQYLPVVPDGHCPCCGRRRVK
ncbi:unnamed protein product [uncultured bacterium]|nr:unnamed protein product [uncultured bacterium]